MKLAQRLVVPMVATLGMLTGSFIAANIIKTYAQDLHTSRASRKRDEEGSAIVLNKTLAPTTELPIQSLNISVETAAQQMRAKDLQVFASDTGRCLAVTAARTPTEEEVKGGRLPDNALASLLAGSVTQEQLAKREKGYLRLENLSPLQRLMVEQIAKRREMIDGKGQPTEAGTQLLVEIHPHQVVYMFSQEKGRFATDQIDILIHPPTQEAVPTPKLRGSLLWWSWPHATETWGEETVSLAPSTYSIRDLASKLSAAASWKVEVDRDAPDVRLSVVSRKMPLRKMLWAVAVAAGLQLRVLPKAKVAFLATRAEQQPEGLQGDSGAPVPLFQLPGSGYASPLLNKVTREEMAKDEDFRTIRGEKTLGWKFADLPLLYRRVLGEDVKAVRKEAIDPKLRKPKSTVFWTQGMQVSIGLFNSDSAGGGASFFVPAL